DQRAEHQQVGLDHPLLRGKPGVEVAPDRGQRDVHHRPIDEDDRRAQDRGDERVPLLRGGDHARAKPRARASSWTCGNTCPGPVTFQGSTTSASAGSRGRRSSYSEWLVATITARAPARAESSDSVPSATNGSWRATWSRPRSRSRMSLIDSEP